MNKRSAASPKQAEIVREYGPFPESPAIHGVTFDGTRVWLALGDRLQALETESGLLGPILPVAAQAGSAFDGVFLYQLSNGLIQKIDPETGQVVSSLASPAGTGSSGMTWAEGALWIANYSERKIIKLDPATGIILKTLTSPRYVTGVTFVKDQLCYGTWEEEQSDIRLVSPESGEQLESLQMPKGVMVSGLEYDGKGTFYAGGGKSGKLRAVRRPG